MERNRKMKKKMFATLLSVLAAATLWGYDPIAGLPVSKGDVTLGEWNRNYNKTKAFADSNHIPMVLVWANPGCSNCEKFEKNVLASQEFKTWMEDRWLVMSFAYGEESQYGDTAAKNMARTPSRKYPYVLVYWNKGDGSSPMKECFSGLESSLPIRTAGSFIKNTIASLEQYLTGYNGPTGVGFKGSSATVSESVGTMKLTVARKNDSAGDLKVKIELDADASTLEPSRYEWEDTELTWADGEDGDRTVPLKIIDNTVYDGEATLKFKLTPVSGEAALFSENYNVAVTENDKASPGKLAIASTDPAFAKAATVIAKTGSEVKVNVSRKDGIDGAVTAKVTAKGATLSADTLEWGNRDEEEKTVVLTVPATKTTLNIAAGSGGVKIDSKGKSFTVIPVAEDCPVFESSEAEFDMYTNVSAAESVALADTQGGTISFSKLSGTLPSGLKLAYDKDADAMAITGVPTKAGTYTAVYQVTERRGSKSVPGLTVNLMFTVKDTAKEVNETIAKSRSFNNIMVIADDGEAKRLAGLLTVTVPLTGKVTASYQCAAGKISLNAKSWSAADETAKTVSADLSSAKAGYHMAVTVAEDGKLELSLTDPQFDSELTATVNEFAWSKSNSAAAWQGYYTVDLPVTAHEGCEMAATGDAYLTLKMNTSSAYNAGKVTYAGMLPDGKAVSGTAVLAEANDEGDAPLPVFWRSTTDVFGAVLAIHPNAKEKHLDDRWSVQAGGGCQIYWNHSATQTADAGFTCMFDVYGTYYDANEAFEAAELPFCVVTETLADSPVYGAAGEVTPATVIVAEKSVTVDRNSVNPQKVTLSLNRSTGIVSGGFTIPFENRNVSAKWKGVLLPGCNDKPFINGACWFNDTLNYTNARGQQAKLTVTSGCAVSSDPGEIPNVADE